jgi:hypothetical protein
VAQTLENKEMHFAIELLRGALLVRKAGALLLLRIPTFLYILYLLSTNPRRERDLGQCVISMPIVPDQAAIAGSIDPNRDAVDERK